MPFIGGGTVPFIGGWIPFTGVVVSVPFVGITKGIAVASAGPLCIQGYACSTCCCAKTSCSETAATAKSATAMHTAKRTAGNDKIIRPLPLIPPRASVPLRRGNGFRTLRRGNGFRTLRRTNKYGALLLLIYLLIGI